MPALFGENLKFGRACQLDLGINDYGDNVLIQMLIKESWCIIPTKIADQVPVPIRDLLVRSPIGDQTIAAAVELKLRNQRLYNFIKIIVKFKVLGRDILY